MWALQAWGELALGLAAPRAANAAGGEYGNQTLAWDVVRCVSTSTKGVGVVKHMAKYSAVAIYFLFETLGFGILQGRHSLSSQI